MARHGHRGRPRPRPRYGPQRLWQRGRDLGPRGVRPHRPIDHPAPPIGRTVPTRARSALLQQEAYQAAAPSSPADRRGRLRRRSVAGPDDHGVGEQPGGRRRLWYRHCRPNARTPTSRPSANRPPHRRSRRRRRPRPESPGRTAVRPRTGRGRRRFRVPVGGSEAAVDAEWMAGAGVDVRSRPTSTVVDDVDGDGRHRRAVSRSPLICRRPTLITSGRIRASSHWPEAAVGTMCTPSPSLIWIPSK